ncbi:hypothetical protein SAMN04488012_11185 [Palleronia salina]|uniref:Uncharacterized protein n=1 Tax=Palleronia salina TaxID=313368 RepID=A0A1M6K9R1_9RHOB|nr:hypothetical protein [Palleronia salina]SHJ55676.1 hypothetical protein SAMN04488012_11185 [Palleronia salina]
MSGVVAVGLGIGMGIGSVLWERGSGVVETVQAMLTERCLPYMTGGSPDVSRLEEFAYGAESAWADPETAVFIKFDENGIRRSCDIQDDLVIWSKQDRDEVLNAVRTFAHDHIAPLNSLPLVEVDLTVNGVGEPFFLWREAGTVRPSYATGFITFLTPKERGTTNVSVDYAPFVALVANAGAADA